MYIGIAISPSTGITLKQMSASEANIWMAQGKEETKTVYLVPDDLNIPTFSPSCSVNTAFLTKIIIDKGKSVAKHTYP